MNTKPRTFTLSGLSLVALGACKEGKRLFLTKSGIKNASRLGEKELDLISACTRISFPPQGETWDAARWVQVWIETAKTGYLGWLVGSKLWFELDAGDAAVQAQLLPLLKDADGDVRYAAAQALAAHPLDAAVQAQLLPLLKDADGDVRRAAAQALAAHAGDAAVQAALAEIRASEEAAS